MYSDNSLLPKEALRLSALGLLAIQPMRYAALANEIRHFTSRIAGPSLDLMGTSIEILRHEGLIAGTDEEDPLLELTDLGRASLDALLRAAVRPPFTDTNKLLLALKMRFLHLLDRDGQIDQLSIMVDAAETELARLVDLRAHNAEAPGHLTEWIDHDVAQVEGRLSWLREFQSRL